MSIAAYSQPSAPAAAGAAPDIGPAPTRPAAGPAPDRARPDEAAAPDGLDAEFAEIDFEGRRYAVPKPLETAFLREADYRQKAKALADAERAAIAGREAAEAERRYFAEHATDIGRLASLDREMDEMRAIERIAIENRDAQSARRARARLDDLFLDRERRRARLDEGRRRLADEQRAAGERRLQATTDWAKANLPGWTPEIDAEIGRWAAREYGFEPAQFEALKSPKAYRALHRLWSLENAARAVPAEVAAPAAPVAPIARGRAAAATAALSDKAPIGEWMKARRRQLGQL